MEKAWISYNDTRNDKKLWDQIYEHDAMLAFWLAIDRGDIQLVKNLIDWDVGFRYTACLAFYRKKEKNVKTF